MARMGLRWIMNVVEDADGQYQQQKDYFVESMQVLVRMVGGRSPLSPLPAQFRSGKERILGNSRHAKLARCEADKENWEGEKGRSGLKRRSEDFELQKGFKRSKIKVTQEEFREKQALSELKWRLEAQEKREQSRASEANDGLEDRRNKGSEHKKIIQDGHGQNGGVEQDHRELKRKLESVNLQKDHKSSRQKWYGGVEDGNLQVGISDRSRTPIKELVVPDSPVEPPVRADHLLVKDVILTCSKHIQRGSGFDSICLEQYNFRDDLPGASVEAQNSSIRKDVPVDISATFELKKHRCDERASAVVNDAAEYTLSEEICDEQLQANGKNSASDFREHADLCISDNDGVHEEPSDLNIRENALANVEEELDQILVEDPQDGEGSHEEDVKQLVQEERGDGCEQLQLRKSFLESEFQASVDASIHTREEDNANCGRQFDEFQSVADSEAENDDNERQERVDSVSQFAETSDHVDNHVMLGFNLASCTSEEHEQRTTAQPEGEYENNDRSRFDEVSDRVTSRFDALEYDSSETKEDIQKELREANAADVLVEAEEQKKFDEQIEQDDVGGAEFQKEERECTAVEEQQAVADLELEAEEPEENANTKKEALAAAKLQLTGEDPWESLPSAERKYESKVDNAGDNEEEEALHNADNAGQQHFYYEGCLSFDAAEELDETKEDQEDSRTQEKEEEEKSEEDDEADAVANVQVLEAEKNREQDHQQSLGEWENPSEYNEALCASRKESEPERLEHLKHNQEESRVQREERAETLKSFNLVSNVRSFLPLVMPQQPTISYANGKKDVRVKALEAAEAARKQEEKRAEERKARKLELLNRQKESLCLPTGVSARSKRPDTKKLEREQRKKDEEWKKKEAELISKKRKKEEAEKKEREDKRKKVDDVLRMKKEQEEKLRLELEEKEQRRKAMEEALVFKKAMEEEQRRQKRLEKEKEIERRRKADEEAKANWLANKEADRKRREEAFQRMKVLEREQRRHADKAELVAATASQDLYDVERRSTASRLSTLRPGTILQREKSLGLVGHASRIPTGSAPRKAASLNQLRNSFNAKHSLNGTEAFAGTPVVKKSLDQRYCTPLSDELVVDEEDDEEDDGPVTYEISPYKDDDDDDDDDDETDDEEDAKKPSKPIPRWAWKDKLLPQLVRQAQIDPDRIFRSAKSCSLNEVFGTTGNRRRGDFSQRSGSGDWSLDIASWKEELLYKKSMGYL